MNDLRWVFILGAGCSAEDNAPLINNFFERAFGEDLRKNLTTDEKVQFDEIRDYRDSTIPNANIEELFSFVDLKLQLSKGTADEAKFAKLRTSLMYLIWRTMRYSLSDEFQSNSYKEFMEQVRRLPKNETVAIITLNWDILLDNAVMRRVSSVGGESYQIDYGLDFHTISDSGFVSEGLRDWRPPLYKLHGSLNWILCKTCRKLQAKMGDKAMLNENGKIKEPFACKCSESNENELLLVPPTFNKLVELTQIRDIWESAKKELSNADKISIIGYSLPDADMAFNLHLKSALIENLRDKKEIEVEIVNHIPYSKDRELFEDRYRKLIESVNQSKSSKGTIRPIFRYMRFSEYFQAWI